MPVARPRRRDARVPYVVVKRDTGYDTDSDDDDLDDVIEDAKKTASVTGITNTAIRVQPTPTSFSLAGSSSTATRLENNLPTNTPRVGHPDPPPRSNGGISQTTQHLLIGAGSVGATIIIVMVIFAFHTMRKHSITFAQAVKRSRYLVTSRGPPPPPPPKSGWDKSGNIGDYQSNRAADSRLSLGRSGSTSSQRPLMALARNDSFNTRQSTSGGPIPPAGAGQRSFYLEPAPPGRKPSLRTDDQVSSPPTLLLQGQTEDAELPYPAIPQDRTMSPRRPPPTFRQFLSNRPSISTQKGIGPMISRFSWTNSNAPQTPHDPSRDTNSHTVPTRDSFMTQRSSIPRFRTVDSWVTQQANRLEEQKLAEQLRGTRSSTSTTTTTSDDRDNLTNVPEVPELPKNVLALQQQKSGPPPRSPLPAPGLPGKNVRHERHDTNTTNETAPIFRQHPGNEVRFSTRSLVPSEILNSKMRTSVL